MTLMICYIVPLSFIEPYKIRGNLASHGKWNMIWLIMNGLVDNEWLNDSDNERDYWVSCFLNNSFWTMAMRVGMAKSRAKSGYRNDRTRPDPDA